MKELAKSKDTKIQHPNASIWNVQDEKGWEYLRDVY